MSGIQARKQQHVRLALDDGSQGGGDAFGDYRLPYRALPDISLDKVGTTTKLLGKKLNQPLIIASMTGGTEHAGIINRSLAEAAEQMRVALGVGSQRAALERPETAATFKIVRKFAPRAVIFANMGAVQLNYGRGVDDYRRVVEMVEADGLYLHLNPLQEAIQPEGDTDFENLASKIQKVVKMVGVPVFVKEVGHGIDEKTARTLIEMGVAGIDTAGVGGTSWAWIETQRAKNPNFSEWFADFGWPTDKLLPQVVKVKSKSKKEVQIIASGGIRSPIQGLKARALGADFYSAARPFLAPAMSSAEEVIKLLKDWEKGLRVAMFACGVTSWEEAKGLVVSRSA